MVVLRMPMRQRAHWLKKVKPRTKGVLIGALALLAVILVAIMREPPPAAPADRAITLPATLEDPLRIVAFGTSLTALYDWPEGLAAELTQCLGRRVEVVVVAEPGRTVRWAAQQIETVLAQDPDIVLIEFSINDADLLDGLSLRKSTAAHEGMIGALTRDRPERRLVLMTMSPAHGMRGALRPRLSRYYQSYRGLAQRLDLGLVDTYPRWLAQPGWKDALADGLHPDAAAVRGILLPPLKMVIGCPDAA